MTMLRAACVQMDSGPDVAQNLADAGALIREAAGLRARLIATPEVTDQVVSNRLEHMNKTYPEEAHPALPFFADMAAKLGVWILVGSICVTVSERRCANRSLLFSPDGLAARYDKIHLYDADLRCGESHRESRAYRPGGRAVVADTPWGGLGMAICYDLRFSHLFRDLAKAGAAILSLPAAFTVPSGRAHWEVLLRARAIETSCFVLAPGQGGAHAGARKTWGHSMIVGPWGDILAERDEPGPGVIVADLPMADVTTARAAIPALRHDRFYRKP